MSNKTKRKMGKETNEEKRKIRNGNEKAAAWERNVKQKWESEIYEIGRVLVPSE